MSDITITLSDQEQNIMHVLFDTAIRAAQPGAAIQTAAAASAILQKMTKDKIVT